MGKRKVYNLRIETDLSEDEIRKLLKKKHVSVLEYEKDVYQFIVNFMMHDNLKYHFGNRQLFKNTKSNKLKKMLKRILDETMEEDLMDNIVNISDMFEDKYIEITEEEEMEDFE